MVDIATANVEEAMRQAYRRYRQVQTTGDLTGLAEVETETDAILRRWPGWPDAHLLRAEAHLTLHRLPDARRELMTPPGLAATPRGRALLAAIDLEEGRYEQAQPVLLELAGDGAAWDDLARLAQYHALMGDADTADREFAAAEDDLTAKELPAFALVELQRGLLDLQRSRYEEAAAHYERAARADSSSWLVRDHQAELAAAQGDLDRGARLYEDLASSVRRPEIGQALGDLYLFADLPALARPWHKGAEAAYRASVERGEVHYLHHLADLLADIGSPEEAVAYARRDLDLRQGLRSHAALGWALHQAGHVDEACRAMDQALMSGARPTELLARAADVFEAGGRSREAAGLRARALTQDPGLGDFRAHR